MKNIDILYIAIGTFYLVLGMTLGIVMGMQRDFQLVPVHAHVNLVGFAAHCVFGLVYRLWPDLKQGAMAIAQFWIYVVGTPLLLVGIAIALKSDNAALAIVGSLLVILGTVLFFVMILQTLWRTRTA